MVLTDIEVNGEAKKLYVDKKLFLSIEKKIKPKIHKKDFDWVWVIDGPEGSGKSVFGGQLAKIIDPTFNVSRVCMTPHEFTTAILKAKKGQCVVFDEAFTGFSSRASLTEINRLLVALMMEMRAKNLAVIIIMPTIFLLDRYVALFRARGLFHVYLKNGRRGQWCYFNNKKKKLLYLKGKKLFSYNEPRSRFRGRFYDTYCVNEAEYRKKKGEALLKKSRQTKSETYKFQRDILFYILHKRIKNYSQMAKICKDHGYKIDRTSIYDIIMAKEKEIIENNALEEEKAQIMAEKTE